MGRVVGYLGMLAVAEQVRVRMGRVVRYLRMGRVVGHLGMGDVVGYMGIGYVVG